MRRPVWFVDTTILLNLLDVPGRAGHRTEVVAQQGQRLKSGDAFVLPVAAVVETGNFIAQLPKGHDRLAAGERFMSILRLVARGETPWRLHSAAWDDGFLDALVAGSITGHSLAQNAVRKLGCGDLSILVERETYRSRTGLTDVRIWTLDAGLLAYA